ncbi:MAG: alpha/beta hydrolase [Phycisphaerales bacterium]|nr:alpha/beta hydrolase [Phycisphaerales bacterium]
MGGSVLLGTSIMGLISLFILAACLLLLLGTCAILNALIRPPRTTFAEAIAVGRPSEPAELNVECDSWELRTEDGLDLPVWDIPGVAGGPTMLWLHDHGRSRIDALVDIQAWLKWCGRVVMVDLRGHGDAPGSCMLGRHEQRDVDRLIDMIEPGTMIVAGRGFGAVLAMDAAQRHPHVCVWAIAPRQRFEIECAAALRENNVPSWPLCALAHACVCMLGRRPIEPCAPIDAERVHVADATEPVPEGPWWSRDVSGDASSR